MDSFIETILFKITKPGKSLSIVQNTDGFLSRADTQEAIRNEADVLLLPVSSIHLRIHYERWYKGSGERVCYVVEDIGEVLPDIKQEAHCCVFNVSDILWGYDKTELARWNPPYSLVHSLFQKDQKRFLTAKQTREIMGYADSEAEMRDLDKLSEFFHSLKKDWLDVELMDAISRRLLYCIRNRWYLQVEPLMNELNDDFQRFMDKNYMALLSKSHVNRPHSVNKILTHINYANTSPREKVALFVIDGMAYWQFLMLKEALEDADIPTIDNVTFAWLPSITKLSRQAIFRGDTPRGTYIQNPSNESKLWVEYWKNRNVQESFIHYEHDGSVTSPESYTRYGYVCTSLDEHMHGCRDLKDLYDLSNNRMPEIVREIKKLYDAGYRIYITADHGNVFSHAWRALTPQEKTMVYANESRGARHLIFTKEEYREYFFQQNEGLRNKMFERENYAVWRDAACFKGSDEITHGGCHFLEMIVPFITIERK